MSYQPFLPPRSVREYRGQVGSEASGLKLPWYVLDSLGTTIPKGVSDQYVVIGEHTMADGRKYLEFGVTRAYVEAVSNYRYDEEKAKKFRVRCLSCNAWDEKHVKGCTA